MAGQEPRIHPVFSTEIFQAIIHNLASANKKTAFTYLRSCSLVSQDFLCLSQRHLFRSVHIGLQCNNISFSRRRLLRFLDKYPYVANYIKVVQYDMRCREKCMLAGGLCHCQLSEGEESPLPNTEKYSISLHERLPAIEDLRIHGAGLCGDEDAITASFSHKILEQFSYSHSIDRLHLQSLTVDLPTVLRFLPTLESLHSQGCRWIIYPQASNQPGQASQYHYHFTDPTTIPYPLQNLIVSNSPSFPFRLVQHFPSLKSFSVYRYIEDNLYDSDEPQLDITALNVGGNSHVAVVSFSNLREIDSVSVGVIQEICCQLAETKRVSAFPSLTKLEVDLYDKEHEQSSLTRILHHAPALQDMRLFLNGFNSDNFPHIQLDNYCSSVQSSLRHLTVDWSDIPTFPSFVAIDVLCQGLDAIRGKNRIQSLDVRFEEDLTPGRMLVTGKSWRDMDTLLMEGGFPDLSCVRISLSGVGAIEPGAWEEALPLLHAKCTRATATNNFQVVQFDFDK